MRGLYPLCLIPGTRRVVRAALLPRGRRLPGTGTSRPVRGCSPSSPVLSCGTKHPRCKKSRRDLVFVDSSLLGWVVCIYLPKCLVEKCEKRSPLRPSEPPQFRVLPSVEKSWFFVLRANNGGRLPGGGNLCSFFPCRSCSSCCSNPFTHTHARLCKPRLPLLLAQYAGTDRETGKDAGLGVRAQLLVLSFNAERGKGLHLITVKCKTLP